MHNKNIAVRVCSLSLALSLAALPGHSLAVNTQMSAEASHAVGYVIEPRFKYISQIVSSLVITDGVAGCTGSYTMFKDMDGTITVELQRFVNGRWTSYKTASESFEGNGVKMLNEEWSISSGRYRCHTIVEIFDANGDSVEKQTFDCDAQDY